MGNKVGIRVNRERGLLLLGTFMIVFNCWSFQTSKKIDIEKPNIVFILADDLGWADLPSYGNKFNEAPNLSNLAKNGIKFTSAYAASAVCSPTRASIITGQYPARIGINDYITGHWRPFEEVVVPKNKTQYLPLESYSMGEAMKKAGYITGYFGKWHLGPEAYFPSKQGFDKSIVFNGFRYKDVSELLVPAQEVEPSKYLGEVLTNLSLDFIEDSKDSPFFLFLSHFDVHLPLDSDSETINRYLKKKEAEGYTNNAIYAAMIEQLDRSLGRILKKLERLKKLDNTLIIFFSDNGGLERRFDNLPVVSENRLDTYKNGNKKNYVATSNFPLRGEKGTIYEGGIRVPLIAYWPKIIKKGRVSKAMVSSIDFLPTFMDLADEKLPDSVVIDGRSILPIFKDNNDVENKTLFWHYPVYHHDVPASAIRQDNWKLIENLSNGELTLFDLENDIGERTDLSEKYPRKVGQMYTLLNQWRKEINAPMPYKNPDFKAKRRYEWGIHPDKVVNE